MKMKRIAAIVLMLLMIVSLAACDIFSGSSGSVYWLNYKPELDETLHTLAARYKEEKRRRREDRDRRVGRLQQHPA